MNILGKEHAIVKAKTFDKRGVEYCVPFFLFHDVIGLARRLSVVFFFWLYRHKNLSHQHAKNFHEGGTRLCACSPYLPFFSLSTRAYNNSSFLYILLGLLGPGWLILGLCWLILGLTSLNMGLDLVILGVSILILGTDWLIMSLD